MTRLSATLARLLLTASLGLALPAHAVPATPPPVVTEARQARIAQVADAPTRQALTEMLFILHQQWRSEDMLRQPPAQTLHTGSPFQAVNDYPDTGRMADVFAAGVVGALNERGDIGVVEPFALPYPHTYTWRKVRFLDRGDIALDAPARSGVTISVGQQGQALTLTQPAGTLRTPESLDGELTIALPKSTPHADFTPADLGKPRTLGDFAFTLRSIDGHRVEIGVTQADGVSPQGFNSNAVLIEALDAGGQPLFNHVRLWGSATPLDARVQAFDRLSAQAAAGTLTVPDTATLLDRAGFRETGGQLRARYAFQGQVARVRVTLMVPGGATLTRPLATSVLPLGHTLRNVDLTPLALAGSVYDHVAPDRPQELSRPDVAARLTAARIEREGQPVIRFGYPDVLSDRFIAPATRFGLDRAVSVTFLDARGKPINVREGQAYDRVEDGIRFDPRQFPVAPVRAKGRLSVTRMISFERHALPVDGSVAGVTVRDNLVLLDPARLPYVQSPMVLTAADATGRALRQTGAMALDNTGGPPVMAVFFQGTVARLDATLPGPVETVPVDFDVSLR